MGAPVEVPPIEKTVGVRVIDETQVMHRNNGRDGAIEWQHMRRNKENVRRMLL
jgi:hypothetical protein